MVSDAGIHKGDGPRFCGMIVDDPFIHIAKVKGYIRLMEKIVSEVFLDAISLISQADDEVVETKMGIGLHDMPENWLLTDFNHRFRLQVGFFTDSCAETTCKDNYFQFNASK